MSFRTANIFLRAVHAVALCEGGIRNPVLVIITGYRLVGRYDRNTCIQSFFDYTVSMQYNTELFVAIASSGQSSSLTQGISIFLASYLDKIAVVCFVSWWVWELVQHTQHHRIGAETRWLREGVLTFITLFCVLWIVVLSKNLFHIPRPSAGVLALIAPLVTTSDMWSFPSGHAAVFAGLATSIAYFRNRFVFLTAVTVGLLISVGRIMVGVHTPIDILAGWGIGVGVAILVHRVFGDKLTGSFVKE